MRLVEVAIVLSSFSSVATSFCISGLTLELAAGSGVSGLAAERGLEEIAAAGRGRLLAGQVPRQVEHAPGVAQLDHRADHELAVLAVGFDDRGDIVVHDQIFGAAVGSRGKQAGAARAEMDPFGFGRDELLPAGDIGKRRRTRR